jgi:peptide-methionine (S)-S-oxide reductase
LLAGEFHEGDAILVDVEDEEIVLKSAGEKKKEKKEKAPKRWRESLLLIFEPSLDLRGSPDRAKTASQSPFVKEIFMGKSFEVATLAGGCFWCLEAVFDELQGVKSVESGYSGGTLPNPTYHEVCGGETGHAEAVQVTFDPAVLSYRDLLTVFFTIHDPTTLNRQGNDVGTQYRSAIFYHDEEQKRLAEQVMGEIEASGIWDAPLVTELPAIRSLLSG